MGRMHEVVAGAALLAAIAAACPAQGSPGGAILNDPFVFADGSPVASGADWDRRREEIGRLARDCIYGDKPPVPSDLQVEPVASARFFHPFTGESHSAPGLKVRITEGGRTIGFTCEVRYPSPDGRPVPGMKACPAMVAMGFSCLDNELLARLGVAIINLPVDAIAAQQGITSRGKGLFYDIYGADHSAGALMAWAWAADCLVTGLERNPGAGIDAAHLGVTGGSRWGKGALAAGAFCGRFKLVIPQESGCGGSSSWKVLDALGKQGKNVQTLEQIITENPWLSVRLDAWQGRAADLPVDQHLVMALVAPRGLYLAENNDMEWLGPPASWRAARAAREVYRFLGAGRNLGFSQPGGHGHCQFPPADRPELEAFVRTFLLDAPDCLPDIFHGDGSPDSDETDSLAL